MRNLIVCAFLVLIPTLVQAQWTNRYPKVDGYGHQIYFEAYDLPVMNAGPTDPTPSPTKKEIAFAAKGWLWILNLETSIATRITSTPEVDSRPNWSPDGKQIVFVRDNGRDTKIVLLDLTTNEEFTLVDTKALDLDPKFSSDGLSVYYASGVDGPIDLWQIELSSKSITKITNGGSMKRLPIALDKGNSILHLSKKGYDDSIEIFDISTGSSTALVKHSIMSQTSFDLSSDGRTMVYTWPKGDGYEIRLMDVFTARTSLILSRNEGLPLTPKFNRDNSFIYYSECGEDERSELKRISTFGGNPDTINITEWDWGVPTSTVRITSKVDGVIEPVRMSILDQSGHPIFPESGVIHSEGQNGTVFFYSPGETQIEAPVGEITINAVQGFSTALESKKVSLTAASSDVEIELRKFWDPKASNWYAADNHFHLNYGGTYQLDPEDILVDLKAEGVDVAYPLIANLGDKFIEQDKWGYERNQWPIIQFGQEIRPHTIGHIGLIGTKEMYWPWKWGFRYDIYNGADLLNADVLRFARKQNGLSMYVHPVFVKKPFENKESANLPLSLVADAVLGEVDLLEVACLWTDEIGSAEAWHQFLNVGIPINLSAGSDVMNNMYRTMTIGAARMYVKVEKSLTSETYLEALNNGKSFVSTGPQLEFTVNEKEVGEVIPSDTKKAKWKLDVHSPIPFEKVEIYVNGEVVWQKTKTSSDNNETFKGVIDIPVGGWITARVSGSASSWPVLNSSLFAETSPIWFGSKGSTSVKSKIESATKLLNTLNASEKRIKEGYGENPIPNILDHFAKARSVLKEIIDEENK